MCHIHAFVVHFVEFYTFIIPNVSNNIRTPEKSTFFFLNIHMCVWGLFHGFISKVQFESDRTGDEREVGDVQ